MAYLRRSSSSTTGGAGRISLEVQTAAVLDLAARHGDAVPEVITEWGLSGAAPAGAFGGTGRGGRRRAFSELRERVAAGAVSSIYAYSLSRLARSTRDLLDLAELCAAAGVPVRLAKEGDLDFSSPHGRLYLTVLAAVATFEAEVSAERARDRNAAARERGDYIGKPPFGWRVEDGRLVEIPAEQRTLAAARDALRTTGSYRAAARALNVAGVASPRGTRWREGTLRRIADRDAGRTVARDRTPRSPRVPTARFTGLLRCGACGSRLTVSRKRYTVASGERREFVGYECRAADYGAHPRPMSIPETAVLAWAAAALANLPTHDERVAIATQAAAERAALEVRRARLVDAVEDGTLTHADVSERLAAIANEIDALDQRLRTEDIPTAIDWDGTPPEVQAQVAAVLSEVVVDMAGPEFRPAWRDESLRPR